MLCRPLAYRLRRAVDVGQFVETAEQVYRANDEKVGARLVAGLQPLERQVVVFVIDKGLYVYPFRRRPCFFHVVSLCE